MAEWRLLIRNKDLRLLNEVFLGLTFLERRLREAKKWDVDIVHVVVEDPAMPIAWPPMDPRFCAQYRKLSLEEWTSVPHPDVYDIPLYAIIASSPPYKNLLTIHLFDDWPKAEELFFRQIRDALGARWIARMINKPISLRISSFLASSPVTPNMWSYFNLFIGLLSAFCVAHPEPSNVVLGGVLFQLASVFDGVDGELAKFRLEYTVFGAWLDTMVDNVSLVAFLVGIAFHVWNHSGFSRAVLMGWGSLATVLLIAYLGVMIHFIFRKLGEGSLNAYDKKFLDLLPKSDPVVRFSQVARYTVKKDFFSFLFFILCITGTIRYLVFILVAALSTTLSCVLYLNWRYGRKDFTNQASH
jgi:phosphatidylglycerophosphate synthase